MNQPNLANPVTNFLDPFIGSTYCNVWARCNSRCPRGNDAGGGGAMATDYRDLIESELDFNLRQRDIKSGGD